MMKKLLISFAAIAASISCVKENTVTDNSPVEMIEVTLNAGVPEIIDPSAGVNSNPTQQGSQSTRTQIVDDKTVLWTPGDKIKMCFDVQPNFSSKRYGPTAEFESSGLEASKKTSFKGSINMTNAGSYGIVAYPASISFESSGETWSDFKTVVSYDLQSSQDAIEGTFAPDLNLSWATVTKTDVNSNASSKTPINVTFKNLCALIKVVLPVQDYKINEINISSESNGLTGDRSLSWEATSSKQELKLSSFKSAVNEVTLAKKDGSALTPEASYYAVIWPGSHNSLTFTFTDDQGRTCAKTLKPESGTINCEVGKVTEIKIKNALEFKEAEPELTVSTSAMNFVAGGGDETFTFNTNKDWTITSDQLWLTLDQTSGKPNRENITVKATCEENAAYTSRTANITISAGGLTKTIKVTQEAAVKVISLSVSTTSLNNFSGPGSTSSFTITCNDNWTITEIPDWVTLSRTSGTESASPVTVEVTAKQCFIFQGRKGSFVISAGDQVKYINLTQSGPTSLSIGDLVDYASDLQDGQAYAIESYNQRGNYWNCTNVSDYPLAYSGKASGIQFFRFAFVYHKDDSKGNSSDTNYNSRSTGTWQLCSSGTYLASDFKFNKKNIADAMYIAHSNRWGNDKTSDIDMVKPGGTDCIWYSGGYYWGGTGAGNRKWLIYKVNAQY